MKISEIPIELWKEKKKVLEEAMFEIGFDAITKRWIKYESLNNKVEIQGTTLPMSFDCDTRELSVWSASERGAGKEFTINKLLDLQNLINYWYENEIVKYYKGFGYNEN